MREIKFRGICVKTGKWVYGYLIQNKDGKCYIKDTDYNVNNGRIDIIPDLVVPETVGQYTGLKDKNGKEIYEGDILHFQTYEGGGFTKVGLDCYAEVLFGMHNLTDNSLYRSQGFYVRPKNSHSPTSIHYWLHTHNAVVIGNIYEHPELLNQNKTILE